MSFLSRASSNSGLWLRFPRYLSNFHHVRVDPQTPRSRCRERGASCACSNKWSQWIYHEHWNPQTRSFRQCSHSNANQRSPQPARLIQRPEIHLHKHRLLLLLPLHLPNDCTNSTVSLITRTGQRHLYRSQLDIRNTLPGPGIGTSLLLGPRRHLRQTDCQCSWMSKTDTYH